MGETSASPSRGSEFGRIGLQPSARQQPPHPVSDGSEHLSHGRIAGRRRRVELEPALCAFDEDPVEDQGVEVDIEVDTAPETLDHGHHPGPALGIAMLVRGAAIEVLEHSGVDAEHGARQPVVPGESIPQSIGQGEHPLAHRDSRQDCLDQLGGVCGHPPAAAARAEAPAFAREGH